MKSETTTQEERYLPAQAAAMPLEKAAMTPGDVLQQVRLIQEVMRGAMRPGEHYGTIPGCGDKPTLLQPGAEKLLLTFRLSPSFDVLEAVTEREFISYTIRCTVRHIPTGQTIATGVGACNSREAKYRYRTQSTGREVPKEYWDTRDPSILGGSQYSAAKRGGKWVVLEKVEHDNPWDYQNTILKMAAKRAKVAATLNATAASDIFTQDIEDMKDVIAEEPDFDQPTGAPWGDQEPAPAAQNGGGGMNGERFTVVVRGRTKEIKEELKEMKARWDPEKKVWCWKHLSNDNASKCVDRVSQITDPDDPDKTVGETGSIKGDVVNEQTGQIEITF